MPSYNLRVENLPETSTGDDVRLYFDNPPQNVLDEVEIIKQKSTATAVLKLNNADVAYQFMKMKSPTIAAAAVTVLPELIEEISITINGDWLKEIEDHHQIIQVELQAIAHDFGVKIGPLKDQPRKTIVLAGTPWKMKQAIEEVEKKLHEVIKERCRKVQRNFEFRSDDSKASVVSDKSRESYETEVGQPKVQEKRSRKLKQDGGQSTSSGNIEDRETASKFESEQTGKKRDRKLKSSLSDDRNGTEDKKESEEDAGAGKYETRSQHQKDSSTTDENSTKPMEARKSKGRALKNTGADPTTGKEHQRKFVKEIIVDEFKHRYLLEHFKSFKSSSLTQEQTSDQKFKWILGDEVEENLKDDEDTLMRIISKLNQESYRVPDGIDFDEFKRMIETDNKNSLITFIFQRQNRTCIILGPEKMPLETYKWMKLITDEFLKRIKKQKSVGNTSHDVPRKVSSGSPMTGLKSGKSFQFKLQKSSKEEVIFIAGGNLVVKVYKGNMIKQATEVIVNAANSFLSHGGGLARVISNAGGPAVDDESQVIMKTKGKLITTEVVHTSAGKLCPMIKYIIHAVGPIGSQYKDDEDGLRLALKQTFYNCLDYANSKLQASSMSIPPISSGIFGVPLPHIVRGMLEAIEDFDRQHPSKILKEVHFISNEDDATKQMIEIVCSSVK